MQRFSRKALSHQNGHLLHYKSSKRTRNTQVFLAKFGRDILGELLGRPPARRHLSDQRQKNRATAIDADGLAEVLDLKNGDFKRVLRADLVVVRHEAGSGGRRCDLVETRGWRCSGTRRGRQRARESDEGEGRKTSAHRITRGDRRNVSNVGFFGFTRC